MASKLNHDCFRNILEFLDSDQLVLFKCLLVNRSWFEISVPYLWKNPFSIVHRIGTINSKRLLKTIISMFPLEKSKEDKLNSYKYFNVDYHEYGQSSCNYLSFMKIFKSVEFHGFIDKCSRVISPSPKKHENDEGKISSILSYHIYDIIFKNCTQIRQIMLLTISRRIMKMKSFVNFSNLCDLEIGEVRYLEKMVHVCQRIKKIVINLRGEFRYSPVLVDFLKAQRGLKAVHLLSRYRLFHIPDELFTQLRSIEELCLKNFLLPSLPHRQISTLPKLKRLEISFMECNSQTATTFFNVSCPLLEVLKFHDCHPPLNALAALIDKTEGHLQCLYLNRPDTYFHTQVFLRSIAKSCPRIKSLSTIINTTEDLRLFDHLLLSCNELESLTLMSFDYVSPLLLERRMKMINVNWNYRNLYSEYDYTQIEFNKF